jgi:hypothetical protein
VQALEELHRAAGMSLDQLAALGGGQLVVLRGQRGEPGMEAEQLVRRGQVASCILARGRLQTCPTLVAAPPRWAKSGGPRGAR